MTLRITHEIATGLQLAGLHQRTPYAIHHVTHGQLSIARYYGGIKYQGDHYTYFAASDELVRTDVLAYLKKHAPKKPAEMASQQTQEKLL